MIVLGPSDMEPLVEFILVLNPGIDGQLKPAGLLQGLQDVQTRGQQLVALE